MQHPETHNKKQRVLSVIQNFLKAWRLCEAHLQVLTSKLHTTAVSYCGIQLKCRRLFGCAICRPGQPAALQVSLHPTGRLASTSHTTDTHAHYCTSTTLFAVPFLYPQSTNQPTLRNLIMSSSDKVFSQMTSSFRSVLKFSWYGVVAMRLASTTSPMPSVL